MIELDTKILSNASPGSSAAISGNAAVARGVIESGAGVITSYPGTPCAEVIEHLMLLNESGRFYIEWSVNEKVAFEIAASAAMASERSVFVTKHVGMNVASDSLMSMVYSGVRGSMVIISADDPGAYDSPIEQDTRFYARMAEIPGLEVSDQQEAKDMVPRALDLSSRTGYPVFIRITNRVLYGRGRVVFSDICKRESEFSFKRHDTRFFVAGRKAVEHHKRMHKDQPAVISAVENMKLNRIIRADKNRYGIIAAGVGFYYALDALEQSTLKDDISLMKQTVFNPPPESEIKEFISGLEQVLVVEELEPVIEDTVRAISAEGGSVIIVGKQSGHLPHCDALGPDTVATAINRLWSEKPLSGQNPPADRLNAKNRLLDKADKLPSNYLTFCAGCPHRASFVVLRKAIRKTGEEFIVTNDIGCYTMSVKKPFGFADAVFCMGSGIGVAEGFFRSGGGNRVIALIGDSTFMHAGIAPLINSCQTGVDILIYILDNRTVAMTGLQPYPGSGIRNSGNAGKFSFRKTARACGADYSAVIDPFNVKKASALLAKALKKKGVRVVVSRAECVQYTSKYSPVDYKYTCCIDPRKCRNCGICLNSTECPAIMFKEGVYSINSRLCNGCGLCYGLCPYHAISKVKVL